MNGKGRRVSWEGQEAEQEEGWERLGRSEPNDDAQQRLGSESDTRNQRGEEGLRSRRDMCEGGRAHRSVQFNAREGKGEVWKKARAGVYAIECARGSESQKELRRIKGWRWWSIVATVQGRVYAVSKGLGSRGRRRKGTVTWGGEQTRMQGVIQDWGNPPSVGITLESESEHTDEFAGASASRLVGVSARMCELVCARARELACGGACTCACAGANACAGVCACAGRWRGVWVCKKMGMGQFAGVSRSTLEGNKGMWSTSLGPKGCRSKTNPGGIPFEGMCTDAHEWVTTSVYMCASVRVRKCVSECRGKWVGVCASASVWVGMYEWVRGWVFLSGCEAGDLGGGLIVIAVRAGTRGRGGVWVLRYRTRLSTGHVRLDFRIWIRHRQSRWQSLWGIVSVQQLLQALQDGGGYAGFFERVVCVRAGEFASARTCASAGVSAGVDACVGACRCAGVWRGRCTCEKMESVECMGVSRCNWRGMDGCERMQLEGNLCVTEQNSPFRIATKGHSSDLNPTAYEHGRSQRQLVLQLRVRHGLTGYKACGTARISPFRTTTKGHSLNLNLTAYKRWHSQQQLMVESWPLRGNVAVQQRLQGLQDGGGYAFFGERVVCVRAGDFSSAGACASAGVGEWRFALKRCCSKSSSEGFGGCAARQGVWHYSHGFPRAGTGFSTVSVGSLTHYHFPKCDFCGWIRHWVTDCRVGVTEQHSSPRTATKGLSFNLNLTAYEHGRSRQHLVLQSRPLRAEVSVQQLLQGPPDGGGYAKFSEEADVQTCEKGLKRTSDRCAGGTEQLGADAEEEVEWRGQIFVSRGNFTDGITPRTVCVQVASTDTMEKVLTEIFPHLPHVKGMWGGKLLKENWTLAESGIGTESTIVAVYHGLKGGMEKGWALQQREVEAGEQETNARRGGGRQPQTRSEN